MPADGGIRFGSYVLLRRIARGGMAEVFLAQQRGLEGFDRRVAVKRILPHLVDSPDFVKMFLGEAKLAAQLTHPNIVHIYDFGKVEGDYFIAMEYVEGVHAGQLFKLAEADRLSPTMIARIGADAAAALHYAHELDGPNGKPFGIVHRDVSPANLMVSYDGTVKLCDFGIAKAAALTDQRTNPGQVKGKYAYMSPEQTVASQLDGRSDVFSLAIVLWELLARKTIVPRGDAITAMRAIRDGKLPALAQAAPDVPAHLADAVMWALATRREERPTAADLATALEGFIKASPDLATPMRLGAWVRARFPRDSLSGPQQAILDDASPGTVAAPNTAGTGTASLRGTAGTASLRAPTEPSHVSPHVIRTGPRARPPSVAPPVVEPAPPRLGPDAQTLDPDAEPVGDPEAGKATILLERNAQPIHQRPTLLAADPPVLHTPLGARARAEAPELQDTLRDPAPPVGHLPHLSLLPTGDRAAYPPPSTSSEPPSFDPRLAHPPLSTGTELAARSLAARRRIALASSLGVLALATFSIALVVCSSSESRTAPVVTAPAPPPDAAPIDAPRPTPQVPASEPPPPPPPPPALQILKVETRPAGGVIRIDNLRRNAPGEFSLPRGHYTVIAELEGWEDESRTIELGDAKNELEILFTRRVQPVGTLTVKTTPYSDVFIGTRKIGQAPFEGVEVPAGTHTLTFKNPLHQTVRKQVTITAGKLTRVPSFHLPRTE